MNKLKWVMVFLFMSGVHKRCEAELQSSTYGFNDPFSGIFWDFYDNRGRQNSIDLFNYKLDNAGFNYYEKLRIIRVAIDMQERGLLGTDMDVRACLYRKYGFIIGKLLYRAALMIKYY